MRCAKVQLIKSPGARDCAVAASRNEAPPGVQNSQMIKVDTSHFIEKKTDLTNKAGNIHIAPDPGSVLVLFFKELTITSSYWTISLFV